jgi:hypothetical protein
MKVGLGRTPEQARFVHGGVEIGERSWGQAVDIVGVHPGLGLIPYHRVDARLIQETGGVGAGPSDDAQGVRPLLIDVESQELAQLRPDIVDHPDRRRLDAGLELSRNRLTVTGHHAAPDPGPEGGLDGGGQVFGQLSHGCLITACVSDALIAGHRPVARWIGLSHRTLPPA